MEGVRFGPPPIHREHNRQTAIQKYRLRHRVYIYIYISYIIYIYIYPRLHILPCIAQIVFLLYSKAYMVHAVYYVSRLMYVMHFILHIVQYMLYECVQQLSKSKLYSSAHHTPHHGVRFDPPSYIIYRYREIDGERERYSCQALVWQLLPNSELRLASCQTMVWQLPNSGVWQLTNPSSEFGSCQTLVWQLPN